MKAFVRISLLFLTVVVIALAPFVWNHRQEIKTFSKSSRLPVGGRVYPVSGQEPTPADGLILRAPDLCEVGELVRLDLRESKVDGIVWQIIPNSPDFEVIDDGKRAFFSSRTPGSYMFLIAGARGGVPFLIHHIVTVEGVVPAPGPGPQPDGPTLDAKIAGWVKKVPDYPNRKAHLAGVAGVFAKMAEAPEVKVEQILEATALANSAVLGKDLEKWVPFLDELGNELDAMVAAGKLTTREQYKAVWLQIAKALETASK